MRSLLAKVSAVAFACAILLCPGCSKHPDRQPLLELLQALADALKDDFQPEVSKFPRGEWAFRRAYLTTKRDMAIIERFKLNHPGLRPDSVDAVDALLDAYSDRLQHLSKFNDQKTFTISDADFQKQVEHLATVQSKLKVIAKMIDK